MATIKKIKKYQIGGELPIKPTSPQRDAGGRPPVKNSPIKNLPYKPTKIKQSVEGIRKEWSQREKEMTTKKPSPKDRVLYKTGGKIVKKAQNGATTKTVDINKSNGVFAPITVSKAKYDSALNKRKASMDSTRAEFRRKIDSGRVEFNKKLKEAKEKNKSPKKMMTGGMTKKCKYGCK